jgi:hypothetical protein
MSLVAQMSFMKPESETVVGFVFITLAFLFLSAAVIWMHRTQEARLMLLGILVAVAATGYGTMVAVPTVSLVTPALMKIAVILVLGGVACSVLSYLSKRPAELEPKEPTHV